MRLFSVDGGHTAELARHDMLTADGAIGEQGIIILDDFFNEAWPGVLDRRRRALPQRRTP